MLVVFECIECAVLVGIIKFPLFCSLLQDSIYIPRIVPICKIYISECSVRIYFFSIASYQKISCRSSNGLTYPLSLSHTHAHVETPNWHMPFMVQGKPT